MPNTYKSTMPEAEVLQLRRHFGMRNKLWQASPAEPLKLLLPNDFLQLSSGLVDGDHATIIIRAAPPAEHPAVGPFGKTARRTEYVDALVARIKAELGDNCYTCLRLREGASNGEVKVITKPGIPGDAARNALSDKLELLIPFRGATFSAPIHVHVEHQRPDCIRVMARNFPPLLAKQGASKVLLTCAGYEVIDGATAMDINDPRSLTVLSEYCPEVVDAQKTRRGDPDLSTVIFQVVPPAQDPYLSKLPTTCTVEGYTVTILVRNDPLSDPPCRSGLGSQGEAPPEDGATDVPRQAPPDPPCGSVPWLTMVDHTQLQQEGPGAPSRQAVYQQMRGYQQQLDAHPALQSLPRSLEHTPQLGGDANAASSAATLNPPSPTAAMASSSIPPPATGAVAPPAQTPAMGPCTTPATRIPVEVRRDQPHARPPDSRGSTPWLAMDNHTQPQQAVPPRSTAATAAMASSSSPPSAMGAVELPAQAPAMGPHTTHATCIPMDIRQVQPHGRPPDSRGSAPWLTMVDHTQPQQEVPPRSTSATAAMVSSSTPPSTTSPMGRPAQAPTTGAYTPLAAHFPMEVSQLQPHGRPPDSEIAASMPPPNAAPRPLSPRSHIPPPPPPPHRRRSLPGDLTHNFVAAQYEASTAEPVQTGSVICLPPRSHMSHPASSPPAPPPTDPSSLLSSGLPSRRQTCGGTPESRRNFMLVEDYALIRQDIAYGGNRHGAGQPSDPTAMDTDAQECPEEVRRLQALAASNPADPTYASLHQLTLASVAQCTGTSPSHVDLLLTGARTNKAGLGSVGVQGPAPTAATSMEPTPTASGNTNPRRKSRTPGPQSHIGASTVSLKLSTHQRASVKPASQPSSRHSSGTGRLQYHGSPTQE